MDGTKGSPSLWNEAQQGGGDVEKEARELSDGPKKISAHDPWQQQQQRECFLVIIKNHLNEIHFDSLWLVQSSFVDSFSRSC